MPSPVGQSTSAGRALRSLPISTWAIGAIVLLITIIATVSDGFGGMLLSVGLAGLATATYSAVSGRPSWVRVFTSRKGAVVTLVLALVVTFVGGSIVPSPSTHARMLDASRTGAGTSSAAAPKKVIVASVTGEPGPLARSDLAAQGLKVAFRTAGGKSVSDLSGLVVVSQSPAIGSSLAVGRTVTLVVRAPKPTPTPTPTQVTPTPTPTPTPPPAPPRPEAPAPAAPAPAAPAPPPSTTITGIIPGAFCPDADRGMPGVAANGRTYICGGSGADASGRYHWNTE